MSPRLCALDTPSRVTDSSQCKALSMLHGAAQTLGVSLPTCLESGCISGSSFQPHPAHLHYLEASILPPPHPARWVGALSLGGRTGGPSLCQADSTEADCRHLAALGCCCWASWTCDFPSRLYLLSAGERVTSLFYPRHLFPTILSHSYSGYNCLCPMPHSPLYKRWGLDK